MDKGVRDKKSVRDMDVRGKTALVRVDFNVPFKPGTTEISDDSRICAALPTLRYLLELDCRLVVCSHLGRPKGQVIESLRMAPVSKRLSDLLGMPVAQCAQVVGDEARKMASALSAGDVMMLENTRFHPEEERNDPEFAERLASLATLYVNDAFGAAHRAHASTEGVARFIPSAAGLLMKRELRFLGSALATPRRPFAVILGGAKVSDKIGVLESLIGKADLLLIGGGMAANFIKAQGFAVGASALEDDSSSFVKDILRRSNDRETKLLLPVDVVVADSFAEDAAHYTVSVDAIPSGFHILDIGSCTAQIFNKTLQGCKTVMWNGPQGVFEWESFSHGTRAIAETLAALDDATTVLGGGSTAEAVALLGLSDRMTHVSSGGGASLEFMEGKDLPGVAALSDK